MAPPVRWSSRNPTRGFQGRPTGGLKVGTRPPCQEHPEQDLPKLHSSNLLPDRGHHQHLQRNSWNTQGLSETLAGPTRIFVGEGKLHLDFRRTSSIVKLDIDTQVEDFKSWTSQVKPLFSNGRGESHESLDVAAKATMQISRDMEVLLQYRSVDAAETSIHIVDGPIHCLAPVFMRREGPGVGRWTWVRVVAKHTAAIKEQKQPRHRNEKRKLSSNPSDVSPR